MRIAAQKDAFKQTSTQRYFLNVTNNKIAFNPTLTSTNNDPEPEPVIKTVPGHLSLKLLLTCCPCISPPRASPSYSFTFPPSHSQPFSFSLMSRQRVPLAVNYRGCAAVGNCYRHRTTSILIKQLEQAHGRAHRLGIEL